MEIDRRHLANHAMNSVLNNARVADHVKRGATVGVRIWGDD